MTELLLDGVVWFQTGMVIAVAVVVVQIRRGQSERPLRLVIAGALSQCSGCVIGSLGAGHLVAVTINAALGTLSNEITALVVYPLGLALFIPACWLAVAAWRYSGGTESMRPWMIGLNAWLGILLLGSSAARNPLALFALLNVAVLFVTRRWALRTIAILSAAAYLAMVVASIVTDGRPF